MARIVIDPVTRIEGHLRIEAEVSGGRVREAWASSTMFRGIELILRGRDPRDAWAFAQRICGVCTTVHAIASIRAVERAIGAEPPPNARLLRNLVMAAQCVHDHVIHFYHLHALDWVDLAAAVKGDPGGAARLAASMSEWPRASRGHFATVRRRLEGLLERGQLGPFAAAYWGHPAYRLSPEANLVAVAHYLEALDWQREFIKIHALLGGKNPHPQSFLVGGMATPVDPDSQAALNLDTIARLRALVAAARRFVAEVYLPDVVAVARHYPDWFRLGGGVGNFLAYGDYPETDDPAGPRFFPAGILRRGALDRLEPLDPAKITEYVTRSWYRYAAGDETGLHPSLGETTPHYTGPDPPYEHLHAEGKYSWLKAPRYEGLPMEVGPLARMLVARAAGHPVIRPRLERRAAELGLGVDALVSTLGRVLARAVESEVLVEHMDTWVEALAENMGRRDFRIHDARRWDPASWPAEAAGAGFHEAPRGALGHWVHIRRSVIANYQCVVPSTWNAGPRDARGQPGPYEAALGGLPVADPARPVEILRVLHSFDPCMACGVHVVDARGRRVAEVRVR